MKNKRILGAVPAVVSVFLTAGCFNGSEALPLPNGETTAAEVSTVFENVSERFREQVQQDQVQNQEWWDNARQRNTWKMVQEGYSQDCTNAKEGIAGRIRPENTGRWEWRYLSAWEMIVDWDADETKIEQALLEAVKGTGLEMENYKTVDLSPQRHIVGSDGDLMVQGSAMNEDGTKTIYIGGSTGCRKA